MKEKTAKALYVLARAVGTCPQTFYKAAKDFVDTYEHEEHERRHVAQEHEQPKIGEVYRDIFGNSYLIIGINDEEPVKKSFVTLIYFNASGDLRSSAALSVPLEDFMNPTFKKV